MHGYTVDTQRSLTSPLSIAFLKDLPDGLIMLLWPISIETHSMRSFFVSNDGSSVPISVVSSKGFSV